MAAALLGAHTKQLAPWTQAHAADMNPQAEQPSQPAAGLLQILQLAQLVSGLPAAQQAQAPAAAAATAAAPSPPARHPAPALPAAPQPPRAAGSGTSGGDATAELEAPSSVVGMKLPVTCNDIRGVVYLDQQVVACYCPACEQRVAAGHGRPLFSFTRFERHSGSKAKKWRLSIRIDPGAVKEAPIDEPPLALGQWLDSKGLVSWAPRGGLKIGPSGTAAGAGSSDDEGGSPYNEDSGSGRRAYAGDRRQAHALGGRGGSAFAPAAGYGHGHAAAAAGPLGKRPRSDYETPDLPGHADLGAWLESQRAAFEAVASAAAASTSGTASGGAGGAADAAGGEGAGAAADDSCDSRQRRASVAAQHGAIFSLVYGLLEAGEDRRAFNEVYLPWLNELAPTRLEAEFATLHSYLRLLGGAGAGGGDGSGSGAGMAPAAVRGLMAAYIRAILQRAAR